MGLIKAALGARPAAHGRSVEGNTRFYALRSAISDKDVLAVKGQKEARRGAGPTPRATTTSSPTARDRRCGRPVHDHRRAGQGRGVCAEPGEYTYDISTEPSIFSGDLGENVKSVSRTSASASPSAASPQGSARLLLQHQGAHRATSTARPARSVPRGGPARRHDLTSASAASANTATASDEPDPVLHERLRQRQRGLYERLESTAS